MMLFINVVNNRVNKNIHDASFMTQAGQKQE